MVGSRIERMTSVGRTTVQVLRINEPLRVQHRQLLIELNVFPPDVL